MCTLESVSWSKSFRNPGDQFLTGWAAQCGDVLLSKLERISLHKWAINDTDNFMKCHWSILPHYKAFWSHLPSPRGTLTANCLAIVNIFTTIFVSFMIKLHMYLRMTQCMQTPINPLILCAELLNNMSTLQLSWPQFSEAERLLFQSRSSILQNLTNLSHHLNSCWLCCSLHRFQ